MFARFVKWEVYVLRQSSFLQVQANTVRCVQSFVALEFHMRMKKILFYILIFILLIGGLMGVVKGFVPDMTWFGFRYLLGFGTAFHEVTPQYAVIYGISMAILEIISSILLLANRRAGILFATITLSINACGCLVAILLGDLLAIGSLLTRFIGIYILYVNKG